jgi:hypothetical protein
MRLPTEEIESSGRSSQYDVFLLTIVTLREHARQIVHTDLPIVDSDLQAANFCTR